ncbi:MAG: type II toxin-antitoxin system RelE/ParE family toxin [Planctomycetes bacterium]|nr:type II toxin-antitoxin system RelE/ParE family toxin [Planctomycetota bacterium]
MAEVRWTEEATNWLNDIYEHIAQDNPDAAGRVVTGIYERVRLLRSFPALGHRYRVEPEGDIRILLYGHYRIAYLAKGRDTIEILGVFHTAMDIERYLR